MAKDGYKITGLLYNGSMNLILVIISVHLFVTFFASIELRIILATLCLIMAVIIIPVLPISLMNYAYNLMLLGALVNNYAALATLLILSVNPSSFRTLIKPYKTLRPLNSMITLFKLPKFGRNKAPLASFIIWCAISRRAHSAEKSSMQLSVRRI